MHRGRRVGGDRPRLRTRHLRHRRWSPRSRTRASSAWLGALKQAGAKLRARGSSEPVGFPIDPESLRRSEISTWRAAYGDLDVIVGLPTALRGLLAGYDELLPRAQARRVFGLTVRTPSETRFEGLRVAVASAGCRGVRETVPPRRDAPGMGQRNRERRAEKKRKARRRQGGGPRRHADARHRGAAPLDVVALLVDAGSLRLDGEEETARSRVSLLAESGFPPGEAAGAVDRSLERLVAGAWRNGWQPADLARLARNKLRERETTLVVDAIAAEARRYREGGLDPRWVAQLDEVGANPWSDPSRPLLSQWAERAGLNWHEALWCAAGTLALLAHLPSLPRLIPPPGDRQDARAPRRAGPVGVDAKVLARVRVLLAKAESTTFEAEAEAFTATAQELMARHSLDRAALDAQGGGSEEPVGRRIGIDAPYPGPKAALLSALAEANRCRAVWSRGLCFSTVFGFAADLDAVDVLYTSLLVQANAALRPVERVQEGSVRMRRRSFRQSFFVGFATKIGDRLREAVAATTAEAATEHGPSLLPALVDRSARVVQACDAAFPEVSDHRPGATHGLGFIAGQVAGAQAHLGVSPEIDAGLAVGR